METIRNLAVLSFAGPWSTNWPFVVLPLIGWLLSRRVHSRVEGTSIAPLWKERFGLLLVSLPGAIMLSLGASAILTLRHAEFQTPFCVFVFVGPILLLTAASSQALYKAFRRAAFLKALYKSTVPPSPLLLQVANEVRVPTRQFNSEEFVCVVAGVFRPVVIISTGAVARLSKEELRAVLQHERGHLMRRDTLWASIITFVAECGVLPSAAGLGAYRRARELLTDQLTIASTDRFVLASALIKSARSLSPSRFSYAETFATKDFLPERIRILTDTERRTAAYSAPPLSEFLLIALGYLLVGYPFILKIVVSMWLHC